MSEEKNHPNSEGKNLTGSTGDKGDVGAEEITEADRNKLDSNFAFKLVDTLIGFNKQEITSTELPLKFFTLEEVSCFSMFAQAAPIIPIPSIYPESGFLFFKGVPVPKGANLTTSGLAELEQALSSSTNIGTGDLNLADLAPDMINSYQIASKIYNDRVDKMRSSYFATVKDAKSQVIEVSAAVVCAFVIIIILARLL